MRLFTCDNCSHVVYFDSHQCVQCGFRLGYSPGGEMMRAITAENVTAAEAKPVRRCANASLDICNWIIDCCDSNEFCIACRHNRLVPTLATGEGLARWRRISQAQRHLFYSLLRWNLPHPDRTQDPQSGLVFDFLEDNVLEDGTVVPAMTGHDEGLIAIRAAEADDVTREEARLSVHELYRTLLGHLRHETGHFVWNKLVRDRDQLDGFRAVFGYEGGDYNTALQQYYTGGPRSGWQESFISAYATSHPWEDFAECFAHYLHIVDTLETASAFGIAVNPEGHREMATLIDFNPYRAMTAEQLVGAWVPLSIAINSIQRSMGQIDSYPFVLSPPVVAKLEYVHGLIQNHSR